MYRPVLVTPPAPVVTLAEAKAHLRIDHDDDNTTVEAMVAAAVGHLDGWTGILRRCLGDQEWRIDFDCFERCMRLPLFPLIEITGSVYRDANGDEQDVDAAGYVTRVDQRGAYVRFVDGFVVPSVSADGAAISLTARFGYSSDADEGESLPAALKAAILLLAAHWYEHREAVVLDGSPTPLPMAVDALIAPYRRLTL